MKKLLNYLKDVYREVNQVSFPSRNDVIVTSLNVFIIIFIAVMLIFGIDIVISKLSTLIYLG